MFQATVTMFSGHIIVAIFAEANSPLLGLRFPSEMQFWKIKNPLLLEDKNPLLEYKISTSGTWWCRWGLPISTITTCATLSFSATNSLYQGKNSGQKMSIYRQSNITFDQKFLTLVQIPHTQSLLVICTLVNQEPIFDQVWLSLKFFTLVQISSPHAQSLLMVGLVLGQQRTYFWLLDDSCSAEKVSKKWNKRDK